METLDKVLDVNHLTKVQIIEKYEWKINNLINPDISSFITPTDISEIFGKHVVEWNRLLRDAGILEPICRVGKKGMKDIELIGWRICEEHRKYLLSNGLAIEVKETRDAVYWNGEKITHIQCYLNTYLKKNYLPLLK